VVSIQIQIRKGTLITTVKGKDRMEGAVRGAFQWVCWCVEEMSKTATLGRAAAHIRPQTTSPQSTPPINSWMTSTKEWHGCIGTPRACHRAIRFRHNSPNLAWCFSGTATNQRHCRNYAIVASWFKHPTQGWYWQTWVPGTSVRVSVHWVPMHSISAHWTPTEFSPMKIVSLMLTVTYDMNTHMGWVMGKHDRQYFRQFVMALSILVKPFPHFEIQHRNSWNSGLSHTQNSLGRIVPVYWQMFKCQLRWVDVYVIGVKFKQCTCTKNQLNWQSHH